MPESGLSDITRVGSRLQIRETRYVDLASVLAVGLAIPLGQDGQMEGEVDRLMQTLRKQRDVDMHSK